MSSGVTVAAGLFVAAVSSQAALATEACATRSDIVDQLKGKYQETHRASGLQTDTKMVEIWTSPSSGSWTILVTSADGTSCIAAAGQNWLDLPSGSAPLGQAS